MLAIHLRPHDETYFDQKAARVDEIAEQWVKMRNAEMERTVGGVVEREKGWLKRVQFADVEGRVCFEWVTPWVTPWAGRPWLLYEGDCDDRGQRWDYTIFESIRIYSRAVSINAILFLKIMIRVCIYLLYLSSHPS